MAEKFIIYGGKPLKGVVEIGGYKNAAGSILAATLMTKKECIIDNLPLVLDVFSMIKVLKSMGAEIEWQGKKKVRIKTENIDPQTMDFKLIPKTRISVLLIGPLLSRFKDFEIAHPGGDRIGLRSISTHLKAFKKLGVDIKNKENLYQFSGKDFFDRNNEKKEIILKEFSVTATENVMMAVSTREGKTIIKGASAEPQVQDLGKMLESMGVKTNGVGTHTIEIEGKKELDGVYHRIIPDPIEVGTFITAAALTPGEVEIKDINLDCLDIFLDKLEEIGVNFEKKDDSIKVSYSPNLKAIKIQALPYPGFPTDLLSLVVTLLTQAKGRSLIHDPLYENRLNYVQELRKMGADIELVDPHRAFVFGKTPLRGLTVSSWDIRAGASLVIAGLIAKGKTTIENIYQIDRGYEKIEEKLQKLGAEITRVKN